MNKDGLTIATAMALLFAVTPAFADYDDGTAVKIGSGYFIDVAKHSIDITELEDGLAKKIGKIDDKADTSYVNAQDAKLDKKIKNLGDEVDEQGHDIHKLQDSDKGQWKAIKKIEEKDEQQDGRLDKVEDKNRDQDRRLGREEKTNRLQWWAIGSLKYENMIQNQILDDHSEHLAQLDSQVAGLQNQMFNLGRRMDKAYAGIAMAMAMESPQVDPGHKFGVSMNWGTFEGYNAGSFNGKFRFDDNISLTGGFGFAEKGTVGGRAGLQFQW
jgi:hypothetical protein